MTVIRQTLSIVFVILGLASLGYAAWIGLNSSMPIPQLSFEDADRIHDSVYKDEAIDKLLEQNLRMQEAIFNAQKEGLRSVLKTIGEVQAASSRVLVSLFILVGFSLFCLAGAILIYPRKIKLHNHTLSQMETILWKSWVANNIKDGDDEFTVRKAAYPVTLCGCSDSGVPVHLCGCSNTAVPVHLCGCFGGYLESCNHDLPVHLCKCEDGED